MKWKLALFSLGLATCVQAAEPKNEILWREWYLYSANGVALGYFEEVAERRPAEKQIAITQNWVEREGTETYIGSVATDDAAFSPVAFFSERKRGAQVYKIDGRAKAGQLTVTFKPVKPKGANRRQTVAIRGKLFLSNFLPLVLAKQDPLNGSLDFAAVVEDAKDAKFDSRQGHAEVFAVKKEIRGQTCRRALVTFAGIEGEWWVSPQGKLCSLHTPANGAKLELVTEQEAKKAFGDGEKSEK